MTLHPIEAGNFKLDGGAMFGVVPKSIWNKTNPADVNNMIDIAARCLLIENGNKLTLIDMGMGNKQSNKFFMKRGIFFLFKYFFLLKTKFAMKKDIIHTLFTIWKFVLSDKLHIIFANDVVEFLENESLLNQRIKLGQKKIKPCSYW